MTLTNDNQEVISKAWIKSSGNYGVTHAFSDESKSQNSISSFLLFIDQSGNPEFCSFLGFEAHWTDENGVVKSKETEVHADGLTSGAELIVDALNDILPSPLPGVKPARIIAPGIISVMTTANPLDITAWNVNAGTSTGGGITGIAGR